MQYHEMEDWRQRVFDAVKADGRDRKPICLAAGLNETFLRDLFDRGQNPSVEKLGKLCNELGITLESVFAKHPKSSEDIALEVTKTALGRAALEAMSLPAQFQKLILDGMKGQIKVVKAQIKTVTPARKITKTRDQKVQKAG